MKISEIRHVLLKALSQLDRIESKTGNDFDYLGSQQLPENLGDKNLLLINAMESAMDEGYSIEYNNLLYLAKIL